MSLSDTEVIVKGYRVTLSTSSHPEKADRRPDCAGPVWRRLNASRGKGAPPVNEEGMNQQAAPKGSADGLPMCQPHAALGSHSSHQKPSLGTCVVGGQPQLHTPGAAKGSSPGRPPYLTRAGIDTAAEVSNSSQEASQPSEFGLRALLAHSAGPTELSAGLPWRGTIALRALVRP